MLWRCTECAVIVQMGASADDVKLTTEFCDTALQHQQSRPQVRMSYDMILILGYY